MKVPIRTCVGCGQRSPQGEMHRLRIGDDGSLVRAGSRRPQGRSAYLHSRETCLRAFPRSKGVFRALRVAVPVAEREAFLILLQSSASHGRDAVQS